MNYRDYKELAESCTTYNEVDNLLSKIENDYMISDRQYYNLKMLAINAVYEWEVKQ